MGKTLKKNARRKNNRINHKKQGYKPLNKKTPKKYKKTKKRHKTTTKKYRATNKRYKKTLHARRHHKRTNMRKTRRMNKRTINKKIYYQDGGMDAMKAKAKTFERGVKKLGKYTVKGARYTVKGLYRYLLNLPFNLLDLIFDFIGLPAGIERSEEAILKFLRMAKPGKLIGFKEKIKSFCDKEREGVAHLKMIPCAPFRAVQFSFSNLYHIGSFPLEVIKAILDPSERVGKEKTTIDELAKLVAKLAGSTIGSATKASSSPFKHLGFIALVTGVLSIAFPTSSVPIIMFFTTMLEGTGLLMGIDWFEKFKVEGMNNAPQFMKLYLARGCEQFISNVAPDTMNELEAELTKDPSKLEEILNSLNSDRATSDNPAEEKEEIIEGITNAVYSALFLRAGYDYIENISYLANAIESATKATEEDAAEAGFWEVCLSTLDGASPMVVSSLVRCIAGSYHSYKLNAKLETVGDFKKNPDIASYKKETKLGGVAVFTSTKKSDKFSPELLYNSNVLGICDNAPNLRIGCCNDYRKGLSLEFNADYMLGNHAEKNELIERLFPKGTPMPPSLRPSQPSPPAAPAARRPPPRRPPPSASAALPAIEGPEPGQQSTPEGSLSRSSSRSSRSRLSTRDTHFTIAQNGGSFRRGGEDRPHQQQVDTTQRAIKLINDKINELSTAKYNRTYYTYCEDPRNSKELKRILRAFKTEDPDYPQYAQLSRLNKLSASDLDDVAVANEILKYVGLHANDPSTGEDYPLQNTVELYHYKLRKILTSKIFCLCRLILNGINPHNNPGLETVITHQNTTKQDREDDFKLCCLNEYGIMCRCYEEVVNSSGTSDKLDVFEIQRTDYGEVYVLNQDLMNRTFDEINAGNFIGTLTFPSVQRESLPNSGTYTVRRCQIESAGTVDIMAAHLKDLTVNTLFERQTDNTLVNYYIDKIEGSQESDNELLPTYFLNGVWVNDNTPIATRGIVKLESEDPNSGMDATRQALHDITGRESVKKTTGSIRAKRVKSHTGGANPVSAGPGSTDPGSAYSIPPLSHERRTGGEEENAPLSSRSQNSEISNRTEDSFEEGPEPQHDESEIDKASSAAEADKDYFEIDDDTNNEIRGNSRFYRAASSVEYQRQKLSRDRLESLIEHISSLFFTRPKDDYDGNDLEAFSSLSAEYADDNGYYWGEFTPTAGDSVDDISDNNIKRLIMSKELASDEMLYASLGLLPGDTVRKALDIHSQNSRNSCYTSDPKLHALRVDDCKEHYKAFKSGDEEEDEYIKSAGIPKVTDVGFKELQKQKRLAEAHISLGIKEGWKVLSFSNRLPNGMKYLVMSRMINIMTGSTGTLLGNLLESLTPTVTVEKIYTSTVGGAAQGEISRFPYQYISLPMRFVESMLLIIMLDEETSKQLVYNSMKHLVSIGVKAKAMLEGIKGESYGSDESDESDEVDDQSSESNPAISLGDLSLIPASPPGSRHGSGSSPDSGEMSLPGSHEVVPASPPGTPVTDHSRIGKSRTGGISIGYYDSNGVYNETIFPTGCTFILIKDNGDTSTYTFNGWIGSSIAATPHDNFVQGFNEHFTMDDLKKEQAVFYPHGETPQGITPSPREAGKQFGQFSDY